MIVHGQAKLKQKVRVMGDHRRKEKGNMKKKKVAELCPISKNVCNKEKTTRRQIH